MELLVVLAFILMLAAAESRNQEQATQSPGCVGPGQCERQG